MSIVTKILLALPVVAIVIFTGFYIYINTVFEGIFTGPFYDKDDLIENYEERTGAIVDAKEYFKSILPDSTSAEIEFKDNEMLEIFHVKVDDNYQSNWNLKINSPKVDSLLHELGWTTKELETLKKKLDNANCISISGNNPVVIGWQRSGMGKFSYRIFDHNLTTDQAKAYTNNCDQVFYKENVVLEYGGGTVGPQCFAEKDRGSNK